MNSALKVVLPQVVTTANKLAIDWLLIGATARDLLVAPALPAARLRASLDIDLAVQVASWSLFENLRRGLMADGGFREQPGRAHRLVHAMSGVEVDVLPYGGVADGDGYLRWPDGEACLNVSFYPAIAAAALERVVVGVMVRVPSAAGLVAAKLASWRDAPSRSKDVEDVWFIMLHYLDLVDDTRLYSGPDKDLLEPDRFDYRLAGVRMLGRDISAMDTAVVGMTLLEWLSDTAWRDQLAWTLQCVDETLSERLANDLVMALRLGLSDHA